MLVFSMFLLCLIEKFKNIFQEFLTFSLIKICFSKFFKKSFSRALGSCGNKLHVHETHRFIGKHIWSTLAYGG
jgi:hypothetical protein